VSSPAYSPDINADEANWDSVPEEATANTCFGTMARARGHEDHEAPNRFQQTVER